SVFTNNNANNGGAISNSWTMTITNSTFNNNKASGVSGSLTSGNGAAISNSATLTITQSQFLDNTAINTGGAISNGIKTSGFSIVTRGNLNVTNSLFKNNTATDGGSIYNRYATANLLRNSFENGIAKNGAFIYNYNNLNFIIVSSSVLNLTENTMVNGAATTTGNYIYNLGNAGVLNLTYLNNQTVPVTTGQLVQLVATLTDDMGNNVTGQTITFYVDGVQVGSTTVIEGVALLNYTVPTSWLLGSYHPVTGNYTGSTGFTIVLKNGQLKLGKLDTMTTVDPVSGKPGQTVTINVHVTDENGNPVNGSVTVTAPDGQLVSVTVTNGVGTSTWNVSDTLTPGTYTNLTADYAGNGTYNPSTGNNTAAIGKLNTTTTIDPVSGKPGQTVTINVHVTDENGNPINETTNITTPDGQVIAITITNGEGTGSWTISTSLTPGIYSNLTASFTETVLYNPSQNTTTATITNIPTNSGGNSTSVPSEG
ncbi:MAG: Ig-like domain repeat protein, partial [Methanobacterium paludis]|nr:Ig-like domain repeat protein [Methanobacterium paludis]